MNTICGKREREEQKSGAGEASAEDVELIPDAEADERGRRRWREKVRRVNATTVVRSEARQDARDPGFIG